MNNNKSGKNICPKGASLKKRKVKSIDCKGFPDQPAGAYGVLPATIENFQHLLESFGIVVRFNVTTKKVEVLIPDREGSIENSANTATTKVQSLAIRHGLAIGLTQPFLDLIADRNPYNPVAT